MTSISCTISQPTLNTSEPEFSLKELIKTDKITCLYRLINCSTQEVWDSLLEGQANFFFDYEIKYLTEKTSWDKIKSIIDIGTGNGVYLSKLAAYSPDKIFKGLEKRLSYVEKSSEKYTSANITFNIGDAEVFNTSLEGTADLVLFRAVLQYLKNPIAALENAFKYLTRDGNLVIIDSCDRAWKTSHPIPTFDQALLTVAEKQKISGEGNREITLKLLQQVEQEGSYLNHLYELVYTNLDQQGNILIDQYRIEGDQNKELYFNHVLLLSRIIPNTFDVPVELNSVYDELLDYIADANSWTSIGVHFLVLKKREVRIE